jgi:hypothetical protein
VYNAAGCCITVLGASHYPQSSSHTTSQHRNENNSKIPDSPILQLGFVSGTVRTKIIPAMCKNKSSHVHLHQKYKTVRNISERLCLHTKKSFRIAHITFLLLLTGRRLKSKLEYRWQASPHQGVWRQTSFKDEKNALSAICEDGTNEEPEDV